MGTNIPILPKDSNTANPVIPAAPQSPFMDSSGLTDLSKFVLNEQPNVIHTPVAYAGPQRAGARNQRQANFASLMQNVNGLISGYSQFEQTKKLNTAKSDWLTLMTAIQNGDQQAITGILGDPKKLKLMSKALQLNFLDPSQGANNVYSQAYKAALAEQQQKNQKAGMLQKLIGTLTAHVLQKQPQVQLNSSQQSTLAQQMLQRLPVSGAQNLQAIQKQAQVKAYKDYIGGFKGLSDDEIAQDMSILGQNQEAIDLVRDTAQKQMDNLTNQVNTLKQQIQQDKTKNLTSVQELKAQLAQKNIELTIAAAKNAQLKQLSQLQYTALNARLQTELQSAKNATEKQSISTELNKLQSAKASSNALIQQQKTLQSTMEAYYKAYSASAARIAASPNFKGENSFPSLFGASYSLSTQGVAQMQQLEQQYQKTIAPYQDQLNTLSSQLAEQNQSIIDIYNKTLPSGGNQNSSDSLNSIIP